MSKIFKNKCFLNFVFICLFLLPIIVFAQTSQTPPTQLVPECPPDKECGYAELLELIRRIINWIIIVSVPVSAGVFAWAGFIYMTSGISDKKSEAKSIMVKVFLGFVFILSAWLIVSTIVGAILKDTSILPVGF